MSENESTSSYSGSTVNETEHQFKSLSLQDSKPKPREMWKNFCEEYLRNLKKQEKVTNYELQTYLTQLFTNR